MAVLEPPPGWSLRGTSDDQLLSGAVLRQLLVQRETPVDLKEPLRLPPGEPSPPVKGRQRAARRAVQGAVAVAEAAARAQRVTAKLLQGDNAAVGPSLWRSARIGTGVASR